MSLSLLLPPDQTRRPRRQRGRFDGRSAVWLVLSVSIAICAWVALLIFQILGGADWSRATVLLGFLLPACALAPCLIFLRKKTGQWPTRGAISVRNTSGPLPVPQASKAPADSIPAALPLWRLFERIARTGRTDYPVVDEAGRLVGEIERGDIPPLAARDALGWLVAADIMRDPKRIDR